VAIRPNAARFLLYPVYSAYTSALRARVREQPLPEHVAVILDGNRRWANRAGIADPGAGHRQGAEKLGELIDWCSGLGIDELTVWALSNENLGRSSEELASLFEVLSQGLGRLSQRQGVRIRVFGRLEGLPAGLVETAHAVEAGTAGNEGIVLNVALGYSGRDELVDAARALVATLALQGIPAPELAERIDADGLERHLYTAEHSDPDLIIRTSGETRLSGFLPWQSSHSEIYFTDVYWPAFRELDFLRAIRTFQQRERRFGL
jgi:short-chain Z-isoprenyl diphosphate synthase